MPAHCSPRCHLSTPKSQARSPQRPKADPAETKSIPRRQGGGYTFLPLSPTLSPDLVYLIPESSPRVCVPPLTAPASPPQSPRARRGPPSAASLSLCSRSRRARRCTEQTAPPCSSIPWPCRICLLFRSGTDGMGERGRVCQRREVTTRVGGAQGVSKLALTALGAWWELLAKQCPPDYPQQ